MDKQLANQRDCKMRFYWIATLLFLTVPTLGAELDTPNLYWWDYVFYSVACTAILGYSIILIIVRAFDWLYLSVTGMLVLLLFSSLDGVLANALGAGPQFMATAPLFIGSVTYCALFAGTAWRIKTPHHFAHLKAPFYGFAGLSLALIPAYWWIDSLVPLYATLNTLGLLVLITTIFAPLSWDHLSPKLHKLAIMLPVTLALFGLSIYGAHFLGEGFSRPVLDWVNRVFVLIFIAYSLGFGLIYVLDEIAAKQLADRQADQAARRAAENALALNQAQQDFERAKRIAESRSRQLAEASHDIRQPILALRHAVKNLDREQAGKNPEPIMEAIDYLEELAKSYVPDTTLEDDEVERTEHDDEVVSIAVLLETIKQIHAPQASAQDIHMTIEQQHGEVTLRPLVMVRIMSNLIVNALHHAQAKHIVIGGYQQGDEHILYVQDDGIGMNPEQLEQALSRGARRDAADGQGLGLSIVQAQAATNGWTFNIDSTEGAGTRASLRVPTQ